MRSVVTTDVKMEGTMVADADVEEEHNIEVIIRVVEEIQEVVVVDLMKVAAVGEAILQMERKPNLIHGGLYVKTAE